ncbi:MAG TPA: histidine kinase [Gammaproteobacteria bacterium]|nr:histidine kinase [Gammaproteobacteria bacterium]
MPPESRNQAPRSSPRRNTEGGALRTGISSLEAFYQITRRVGMAVDINEALIRFLHALVDLSHAEAGAIRLLGEDGQLHLVSSVGLDDDMVYRERVLPSGSCVCGHVPGSRRVLFKEDLSGCLETLQRPFLPDTAPGNQGVSMIAGGIDHRGQEIGMFNLYVSRAHLDVYRDYEEFFSTVGKYMGLVVDKLRVAEEVDRLSVSDERTRMANELHDSFAQTMASVRFQVRVLDDTLHEGNEELLWESLEKIESSLDEANDELRELIAHFRAPVDEQGVVPGVVRAVERFRRYCDIPIFFQRHWPDKNLPPEYELQVVRIVQESLANIRKHSQAKTVRVLLQGNDLGEYRVLIEDDGVGITPEVRKPGNAGEHIGLSIMKDRARRINGKLSIESEPGEGTRVLLRFKAPDAVARS